MHELNYEEMRSALAHDLWIERGRPIGSPEVDWLRAEELLQDSGLYLVNAALKEAQCSDFVDESGAAPIEIQTITPIESRFESHLEKNAATISSPATKSKRKRA